PRGDIESPGGPGVQAYKCGAKSTQPARLSRAAAVGASGASSSGVDTSARSSSSRASRSVTPLSMRSRSNARRSSAIGAMVTSWPVTGSRTMVPSSNVAKRAPGACNAQRPGATTAASDTRVIPGEGRSVRRDRAPGRVVQALQAGAEHPARVDAVDAAVLVEEDQRIDMALLLDFLDEERIERHQAVDLRVARRLTELVGRDAGL